MSISQVKQASMIFRKDRYQRVREAFKRANPSVFEMQKETNKETKKFEQFLMQREDLLAKKRLNERH
jgi:hypothetical protein